MSGLKTSDYGFLDLEHDASTRYEVSYTPDNIDVAWVLGFALKLFCAHLHTRNMIFTIGARHSSLFSVAGSPEEQKPRFQHIT